MMLNHALFLLIVQEIVLLCDSCHCWLSRYPQTVFSRKNNLHFAIPFLILYLQSDSYGWCSSVG